MKFLMKVVATALGLAAMANSVPAAGWSPAGPIKLLIAFAAGGSADTQARLIAEDLEARLGWKFIPQQVTGKGGMNLAMALRDMPADGSAIGLVVTETLGYNMRVADAGMTSDDFTAITTTAGFQMAVVSQSTTGWTSFADMVAAAKSGRALRFGVMSPKLADLAYLIGKAQGIEFNIISVRGGRAVMNGVIGGDMDLGFMAGLQTRGVAAGELVNLASALTTPLIQSPDAPTIGDLGVDFDADGYFLFVGPKGMPTETRDTIANAISDVITTEGSKSNAMITAAFGGPTVIAGDAAQAFVARGFDAAQVLLDAVAE